MTDVRKQRIILWLALVLLGMCAIAFGVFARMIPPPDASWPAEKIARFYRENHTRISIGAMIAGWTSAFQIPFGIVIAAQIARVEEGRKIWASLAMCSGALTAVFFAFPPIAWGTAAFASGRAPEITALMHQLGTLTYITTDQMYLFMWVTVAVICFLPTTAKHSPFPRWWGYLTIWVIIMFEAGAVAFLAHDGPFAWNGLLAFWSPLFLYGGWMVTQSYLIFRALKLQQQEEEGVSAATFRVSDATGVPLRA